MREDWHYDESGDWLHAKNDNWIYVGADIYQRDFSKVGKTTVGLNTRHTSSQSPGYFIYTAYNIRSDNVHDIETHLLRHLESMLSDQRVAHFSTSSKSECFWVNPYYMVRLVEDFIASHYGSSVTYENVQCGGMSRYQCPNEIYNLYDLRRNFIWPIDPSAMPVASLRMSYDQYHTGNQVEHEIDLGDGHYFDCDTGREMYRDPDGNEY